MYFSASNCPILGGLKIRKLSWRDRNVQRYRCGNTHTVEIEYKLTQETQIPKAEQGRTEYQVIGNIPNKYYTTVRPHLATQSKKRTIHTETQTIYLPSISTKKNTLHKLALTLIVRGHTSNSLCSLRDGMFSQFSRKNQSYSSLDFARRDG